MLLFRLHKLALRLRPLLPWCLVLASCCSALVVVLLFRGGVLPSPALAIVLALALWALLLFAFIRLFQTIPPPVLPKDTWFERLRSRGQLVLYHLLAAGVLTLGLMLISISLKLLSATSR